MLSRIVAVAAITLCAKLGVAGPKVDMNCQSDMGTGANCVPMVGCVGEEGGYFTGRAIGWSEGTLAVQSSAGAFCSGEWVARNALGVGQAKFVCDDGATGVVFFTYQHPETGTAVGLGTMSDGAKVQVWSGNNIRQFLADQSGDLNSDLTCGDVLVPIS